jgi:hypothetical protein
LDQRLAVETRLPVYLNRHEATLVFVRQHPGEVFDLHVEFLEKDSGYVPASSLDLSLSGPALTHRLAVDISRWPDGEYVVRIRERNDQSNVLVRAIRKQTIKKPLPPSAPHDVAGKKMFFVDDWYIAESRGLTFAVKPAEQIAIDWSAVDEVGEVFSGALRQFGISDQGHLYAEIELRTEKGGKATTRWLVSENRKTWKVASQVPPMSSEFTLRNFGEQGTNLGKVIVPHQDRRYRLYNPERDGPVRLNEVTVEYSGLERNVTWSGIPIPFRSRIAVWVKPDGEALILGDPITKDRAEWSAGVPEGEVGDWRDSNDNFGRPRFTADGRRLRAFQSRRIPRSDPYRVYYDNMLTDRIMVTWATADGLTWTPTYFDAPTEEDPWSTQHYGVDLWSEEAGGLEFAYHRIYDVQLQRVYTELAFSRDGFHWNRLERGKPFLTNGARGEWNFGYAITGGTTTRAEYRGEYFEPMVGIDVLHFMFVAANRREDRSVIDASFFAKRFGGRMVGRNGVEQSPVMQWYDSWDDIAAHTRKMRRTPGLMKYRKDGWVAIEPVKRRGEFTTKTLRGGGPELKINARTSKDGFILVECLDEWENPMPAYSGPNAARFTGDSTGAALAWGGQAAGKVPTGVIRLRVTLENAELYTLTF